MSLPSWPIDRVLRRRRHAERAFPGPPERRPPPALLLVASTAGRELVAERCERARRAGVEPGMTVTEARALAGRVPLLVQPADPSADALALRALGVWALCFSPLVALDPPAGLLLDVHGLMRLFPDERALLERVVGAARALGFRARGAIADTIGCAWALARFGKEACAVVAPGGERAALLPLDVRALRLEEDVAQGLAELGIERVAELLRLPRGELASRFGDALLLRVDQALGQALETAEPVREPLPPAVERGAEGPVRALGVLLDVARELLDELAALLAARESGVRELVLELGRSDQEPWRDTLLLSRPSRDARHLWSLVRPRLEKAQLGFGVERIALRAARWELLPHEQTDFHGRSAARATTRAQGELVDTLVGKLGPERVSLLELVDAHLPERSYRRLPAVGGARGTPAPAPDADRPSHFWHPPEAVEVVLARTPDGPPVRLRWCGEELSVRTSLGPERIGAPWWEHRAAGGERDYFAVELEGGRWLWLFRERKRGAWFVHGEWA